MMASDVTPNVIPYDSKSRSDIWRCRGHICPSEYHREDHVSAIYVNHSVYVIKLWGVLWNVGFASSYTRQINMDIGPG